MRVRGNEIKRRDKELLSEIDKNLLLGVRNSKGDEICKGKILGSAMLNALGIEMPIMNSEGELVEISAKEALVLATLSDAIRNPSTSKLKDIMEITGEIDKSKVDVNVNSELKDLLSDIVIDEVQEVEIGEPKEKENLGIEETKGDGN